MPSDSALESSCPLLERLPTLPQVMATLATIGSFAADTAGAFNRDWYITGGFMLVNGMMVDLFVITCVIQGWGLMLNVGRLVLAPRALTQFEMDALYAGDGANMYVVDRLQLVTKFVVMCYICSAAIPLLYWVVLLVVAASILIDETNLLRRLYPAAQTDESVVRCILVFVMPLAVLCHLFAARVFFGQLRAPSDGSGAADGGGGGDRGGGDGGGGGGAWSGLMPSLGFGSPDDDGLNFVVWSTWLNAPPTLFFIVREWAKWIKPAAAAGGAAHAGGNTGKAKETASGKHGEMSDGRSAPALVERAIAGSIWSRSEDTELAGLAASLTAAAAEGGAHGSARPNRALALSHTELVRIYRKAGREAELRYSPPDTRGNTASARLPHKPGCVLAAAPPELAAKPPMCRDVLQPSAAAEML